MMFEFSRARYGGGGIEKSIVDIQSTALTFEDGCELEVGGSGGGALGGLPSFGLVAITAPWRKYATLMSEIWRNSILSAPLL